MSFGSIFGGLSSGNAEPQNTNNQDAEGYKVATEDDINFLSQIL